MALTLDDIGKSIIIKNTQGHKSIRKNGEYLITKVYNQKLIKLNDSIDWVYKNDDDYVMIGAKSLFEIGDEVVLKNPTTSLERGHKGKILDFYDEEKRKLVIEGLLPGGWIDSTKVFKLLDPTKYRVKTLCEMIRDYGILFYREFRKPNKYLFCILGKSLTNVGEIHQIDNNSISVYNEKQDTYLEDYMICPIDTPLFNCKIVVADKAHIIQLLGDKNDWRILEHANKDITEVFPGVDYDKPLRLYDFFRNISDSAYIENKIKISYQLIQLENQVKEEVAPVLPF